MVIVSTPKDGGVFVLTKTIKKNTQLINNMQHLGTLK